MLAGQRRANYVRTRLDARQRHEHKDAGYARQHEKERVERADLELQLSAHTWRCR